ncbi:hypothetical protein GQ607_016800 [Colletotrichum asianum]|uniref:Uncharacterized protein n=1 Tax=Colletotrichum asianum TaxID=702518 RepID=A0A8H3W0B9_9PEZI|nr:hypothetical protein GQ607_016800 [Colletotrichum asianum]
MSSPEQASPKSESDSMRIFGLSQPTSYRRVCVRCGRWGYFASDKEVTKSRTTTARVPVLQTSCCQNIFCTDCILSTISDGLWDEIWRPQESGYGIPISCPARSCEARRLCLDLETLVEFLLGCGIKKRTLFGSVTRFRYAFRTQRSIHDKIPDMNEWQGKAGNDFHKQLALTGHMWPCDGTWPRGTMMHVARFSFRGGEPIPVFLGLFKDKVKRKPCVVCDGEFMETSSGEVLNVVFYMFGDTQRTPHTGKSGFPPRSVFLDCHSQHKLNCCFRCHDFNIAAKLDDNQESKQLHGQTHLRVMTKCSSRKAWTPCRAFDGVSTSTAVPVRITTLKAAHQSINSSSNATPAVYQCVSFTAEFGTSVKPAKNTT